VPDEAKEPKGEDPNGSPPATTDATFGVAVAGAVQGLVVTLLAAVASLGFVAFVGGAVLWARFYALGLPPDQVVIAVPREYLITVGATVLTGAAVLGVLAIGITYLIDWNGCPSLPTRTTLLVLTGIALAAIVSFDQDLSQGKWIEAVVIGGIVLVGSWLVALKLNEPVRRVDDATLGSPATPTPSVRISTLGALMLGLTVLFRRGPQAAPSPSPVAAPPSPVRLKPAGLWLQALIFGLGGLAFAAFFPGGWVVVGYAVTVLLYLCLLGVARASGNRFAPFAMVLFGAVVLFAAGLAVARALQTVQVQPAVALRTNEAAPVCGVYVAESSDRLYLGRLDEDRKDAGSTVGGDAGHLFWLDRKAVTGWGVSGLEDQEHADEVLRALQIRVLEERRERIATTEQTAPNEAGQSTTTTKKTLTKVPDPDPGAPGCTIYTPNAPAG
jgi:hypothetical protein